MNINNLEAREIVTLYAAAYQAQKWAKYMREYNKRGLYNAGMIWVSIFENSFISKYVSMVLNSLEGKNEEEKTAVKRLVKVVDSISENTPFFTTNFFKKLLFIAFLIPLAAINFALLLINIFSPHKIELHYLPNFMVIKEPGSIDLDELGQQMLEFEESLFSLFCVIKDANQETPLGDKLNEVFSEYDNLRNVIII